MRIADSLFTAFLNSLPGEMESWVIKRHGMHAIHKKVGVGEGQEWGGHRAPSIWLETHTRKKKGVAQAPAMKSFSLFVNQAAHIFLKDKGIWTQAPLAHSLARSFLSLAWLCKRPKCVYSRFMIYRRAQQTANESLPLSRALSFILHAVSSICCLPLCVPQKEHWSHSEEVLVLLFWGAWQSEG